MRHNPQILPEMDIDLVPLKDFSQRIADGWRMVPGYPLEPGDYVVTMCAPQMPRPRRSNLVSGGHSGRVTAEQRQQDTVMSRRNRA